MTTNDSALAARPLAGSVPAAFWLAGTAFLALVLLYFIGLDQGATSVFGSDTGVHEFIHDARHLLGFPCH
jgi:hypothetical protein